MLAAFIDEAILRINYDKHPWLVSPDGHRTHPGTPHPHRRALVTEEHGRAGNLQHKPSRQYPRRRATDNYGICESGRGD